MNHTLIEPLCRRKLGWKCCQCHWWGWQASLFAPTPSEQTWQQWHLLCNSKSKVTGIMLQSESLANTHLLQITTNIVSETYWNSATNHFFCIFIPTPFFLSFSYPLHSFISFPLSFLPSPILFTPLVPSLISPPPPKMHKSLQHAKCTHTSQIKTQTHSPRLSF
jgi:hypothetical protein